MHGPRPAVAWAELPRYRHSQGYDPGRASLSLPTVQGQHWFSNHLVTTSIHAIRLSLISCSVIRTSVREFLLPPTCSVEVWISRGSTSCSIMTWLKILTRTSIVWPEPVGLAPKVCFVCSSLFCVEWACYIARYVMVCYMWQVSPWHSCLTTQISKFLTMSRAGLKSTSQSCLTR